MSLHFADFISTKISIEAARRMHELTRDEQLDDCVGGKLWSLNWYTISIMWSVQSVLEPCPDMSDPDPCESSEQPLPVASLKTYLLSLSFWAHNNTLFMTV